MNTIDTIPSTTTSALLLAILVLSGIEAQADAAHVVDEDVDTTMQMCGAFCGHT